ncbi:MAG: hypothetical protein IKZ13_07130 [Akkermansia sp.]|nr:hypothetical protein [Akkermansia sp.]
MDERTQRLYRTVGLDSFIKYYFVFKYYPQEKCISAFVEDYKPNSKVAKTSAAKTIFKEGKHIDVLKYIRDEAARVDPILKQQAAWYLNLEE